MTATAAGPAADGPRPGWIRSGVLAVVLLPSLLAGGCSSFAEPTGRDAGARPVAEVRASAPEAELTVVADADPAAAAVSTSRALFDSAELVVVAPADDVRAILLGASAAVALGVPLLVEPASADDGTHLVAEELDRLGATTVLDVGPAGDAPQPDAGGDEREVVGVPADPVAIERTTGLEFAAADPVAPGEEPSAVARLEPGEPVALTQEGPTPGSGESDPGLLPEVTRAEPLSSTVVLTTGGPESVAGIATARAAGARVLLTGGVADPRAAAEGGEALSEAERVVALGAGFAAEQGLDWKVRTARAAQQLPAGGQLLFPASFLVALYGTPGSAALGVLGEQGLEASIQRARDTAAPYEGLVDATVVPAFEIIATVASSFPGPDGNYSTETDVEALRPWVEAAGEAGLYVVLDLQPGRTDFLTQAQQYRALLELPHVGLALDPEWRLGPDEVHLQQVGSVGVDEVNAVVTWLADLTREKALPQKLLVVHQFRLDMVRERERLDTSRDELAVMVHADGQGGQADKQATWQRLHQDAPTSLWWGWKNFYDEDAPMLTPEQTVASVSPLPQLISYQ